MRVLQLYVFVLWLALATAHDAAAAPAQPLLVDGYRAQFQLAPTAGGGYQLMSGTAVVIPAIPPGATLRFRDVSIIAGIEGQAASIYRLYQAAFNRVPDIRGLSFWVHAARGLPLDDVAEQFATSSEYTSLYVTGLGNRDFVAQLYRNVLHRDGEPAGVDFWTGVLDKGTHRKSVLAAFADSAENRAAVDPGLRSGIPVLEPEASYDRKIVVTVDATLTGQVAQIATLAGTAAPGTPIDAPGDYEAVHLLLATGRDDALLLAGFSGSDRPRLDSASTALVLVRLALNVIPDATSHQQELDSRISALPSFPALTDAISAAVSAGRTPLNADTVPDLVAKVIAELQVPTTMSGSALAAASTPPLPYFYWDTNAYNRMWLVDIPHSADFELRNRSFLAWRVTTDGGASLLSMPLADTFLQNFGITFDSESRTVVPGSGVAGATTITLAQDTETRRLNTVSMVIRSVTGAAKLLTTGLDWKPNELQKCALKLTNDLGTNNEFLRFTAEPTVANYAELAKKINLALTLKVIYDSCEAPKISAKSISEFFLSVAVPVLWQAVATTKAIVQTTEMFAQLSHPHDYPVIRTFCKQDGVASACPYQILPAESVLLPERFTTLELTRMENGHPAPVTIPFSWHSSNDAVASIDANGRVTGHTPGTVIITASAGGTDLAQAQVRVADFASRAITPLWQRIGPLVHEEECTYFSPTGPLTLRLRAEISTAGVLTSSMPTCIGKPAVTAVLGDQPQFYFSYRSDTLQGRGGAPLVTGGCCNASAPYYESIGKIPDQAIQRLQLTDYLRRLSGRSCVRHEQGDPTATILVLGTKVRIFTPFPATAYFEFDTDELLSRVFYFEENISPTGAILIIRGKDYAGSPYAINTEIRLQLDSFLHGSDTALDGGTFWVGGHVKQVMESGETYNYTAGWFCTFSTTVR